MNILVIKIPVENEPMYMAIRDEWLDMSLEQLEVISGLAFVGFESKETPIKGSTKWQ